MPLFIFIPSFAATPPIDIGLLVMTPIAPYDNEQFIPVNSDIIFGLSSTGITSLDTNTLTVKLNNVTVVSGGVAGAGYSFSIEIGTFGIHYGLIFTLRSTANFSTFASQEITVEFSSVEEELYASTYNFTTTDAVAQKAIYKFGNVDRDRYKFDYSFIDQFEKTTQPASTVLSVSGIDVFNKYYGDAIRNGQIFAAQEADAIIIAGEDNKATGSTAQAARALESIGQPTVFPTLLGPLFGGRIMNRSIGELKIQDQEYNILSGPLPIAGLWTPLDLPGLSVFFDAQTEGAVTVNGSGHVTGWTDDFAGIATTPNTAASSHITYSATGLNGLPAVVFSNANTNWLKSSGSDTWGTVAVVAQYKTGVETTWGATYPGLVSLGIGGTPMFVGDGGTNAWFSFTAALNTATKQGNSQYTLASSVILPMAPTIITASGSPYSGVINIGNDRQYAGYTWHGAISLVVATEKPLSYNDRKKLEGWSAWHCGIESSLPIGHPYKSRPPFVRDNAITYGGIAPTYEWVATDGFIALEDGAVSRWSDRVSGALLSQYSAGVTHSTTNGWMDFNGSGRVNNNAIGITPNNEWHWFSVVDIDSIAAASTATFAVDKIISDDTGAYNSLGLRQDGSGGYQAVQHQFTGSHVVTTTPITLGKHIVECKKTGGNIYVAVDGGAFSTPTAASDYSGVVRGIHIGGSTTYGVPFNGRIFSVRTHTTALSSIDRAITLDYLSNTYSVTLV